MKKNAKFRQMEDDRTGFGYGLIVITSGTVFTGIGLLACDSQIWVGSLFIFFGLLFIKFGLTMVVCYWQMLEFTDDEILLTFGPFLLWRLPISEIRGIGRSIVYSKNIRGYRWEADVIFLSILEPTHIRGIARRWITEEELEKVIGSEADKERYIMQKAMFLYFLSQGSDMRLNKTMGVWMEYSPERADALKQLFPHVENYVY